LAQLVDQRSQRLLVILLQEHYLIRDKAQLLKSDSLHLRPWEALNNPTFLFVFEKLDLKFDQLDYNLILNV
jgi:hypothetical protein